MKLEVHSVITYGAA